MKFKSRYIFMVALSLAGLTASAQAGATEDFAIKATADIGLGKAMSTGYALPGLSAKSSSSDFGVDFGWTFWRQAQNSLEANIGLRYGRTSLKADVSDMDYHYAAPGSADMDNVAYIRYYELDDLHQKVVTDRLAIPLYLNYRYEINDRFSVHALAGMKLGFNVSSKIAQSGCKVYSYGVYPEYDDLMIDASYMNEFGSSTLGRDRAFKPETNTVTFSLMAGVGAEVHVWGPLSADLTFRYEGAVNNIYKSAKSRITTFEADNVPVSYTVAQGQKVKSLSDYLTSSKLSRISCAISLIYRF